MKKIVFALLLSAFAVGFAGSEELDTYVYLYDLAETSMDQLEVLKNMAAEKVSGAEEFYAKTLRRLVSEYKNLKHVTERNAAADQARILSAQLGMEKYAQAAPDLWRVVEMFTEPLVKAEALMALGKIQATAYLPQVIRILQSLNTRPTPNRENGNQIAFGAIIALEEYADPSGYLPVYFASIGWYSERVTSQAVKSLPIIASDPTPFLTEVVKGPGYDYPAKFAALQTIESSGAPNTSKASVAVAALLEGWKASTNDLELRKKLAEMRKLAMNMINRYGTSDEAVYAPLERSYTYGYDSQEKLVAVATLASLRSDESARRLSKFLADLNAKRQSGNIRQEDEQMVRAVIPALGQAGRPLGRPVLNATINLDWTPAVKALASDALKQIGGAQ
ncbi:MAG: hypothetical protein LBD18_03690 [Treponema sp.]|jgi:hypothetical protein|nr:hypothetical protein [Treponema sp.]